MLDTTRVKTYQPGDPIAAAEINAIQDRVIDTANVAQRMATLATAESLWVDRTFDDGTAIFTPVTDRGFVKLQAGGQRGWLVLPGVPDGLALHQLRIRCHIPEGEVAFTLFRTVATEADGLVISRTDSQVPGWEPLVIAGTGWGTLELAGPPVSPSPNTRLWVLVENRHEPLSEWNSLILSSVQGIWA